MKKTPEEVVLILDELSEDANQWPIESNDKRKSVGVHQVDSNTSMQAQLDTMAKEIRKLTLANVQSECKQHVTFVEWDTLHLSAKHQVLTQKLSYAKFLKEILYNKRKLEETTVVKLNAHRSAILQNKIPQKCGNPRSFTIPCSLVSEKLDKALCDSGASINLMPLSVFRKLEGELGVIKSILVSLQLADQTTILPEGIIDDILVRVEKFVLPVDFIVVDMEVNKEVPLILRRPFSCTGRAILDIYEGQLMLRVSNEKVLFQMKSMMKYPMMRRPPTRVSSQMLLGNWM
ncbi:PREDICTED: uncharacterized protein LOC109218079 [Nicotiana attenuata]|uniref:uncharacterized protein LOC109218079 n=1 Tax=Nicotiana attenuata TaxID=49451 RepID=UPI000904F43F|nr:PREDICTED: uncharacterized protein LOC109218079 [Nicotiana attenuata]